jgi:hypothetical protein
MPSEVSMTKRLLVPVLGAMMGVFLATPTTAQ